MAVFLAVSANGPHQCVALSRIVSELRLSDTPRLTVSVNSMISPFSYWQTAVPTSRSFHEPSVGDAVERARLGSQWVTTFADIGSVGKCGVQHGGTKLLPPAMNAAHPPAPATAKYWVSHVKCRELTTKFESRKCFLRRSFNESLSVFNFVL